MRADGTMTEGNVGSRGCSHIRTARIAAMRQHESSSLEHCRVRLKDAAPKTSLDCVQQTKLCAFAFDVVNDEQAGACGVDVSKSQATVHDPQSARCSASATSVTAVIFLNSVT